MRIAARSNSKGPWALVRRREPGVPSGLGNSLLSSRDTKELTRLSSKKPAKTMSRSWRSRHCRTSYTRSDAGVNRSGNGGDI